MILKGLLMKNIIDFGSGPHPKADANIRVDVHQWPGVTHIHDLNVLPYPFDDNFADKIYLGDVIEHMFYGHAVDVLTELRRILKPDGVLDITTPDLEWVFQTLINGQWKEKTMGIDWLNRRSTDWQSAMDYVYGGWRHDEEHKIPGMGHVNGFNEEYLTDTLAEAGFREIDRVDDDRNPEPLRGAILRLIAVK
jgi:predicted SAM-dependent methyltransferase